MEALQTNLDECKEQFEMGVSITWCSALPVRRERSTGRAVKRPLGQALLEGWQLFLPRAQCAALLTGFKSVIQILVFSLCAVFLVQRLRSISRTAYEMKRRLCSTSPTPPSLGAWASLEPPPAVPGQQPCQGSQDLGEHNRHMSTGCPAPELSSAAHSSVATEGSHLDPISVGIPLRKADGAHLRVTILSVQMVCKITKPAAVNRTKFALHWSSKECAGRPGVGPPVCSVLFGILFNKNPVSSQSLVLPDSIFFPDRDPEFFY
ncbi:hypothetical protein EK904_010571 [Melospiza melodia maxima]|nr:hypothetical protein EK904_010571 [Melospiza melodia maxima]